MQTPLSADSQRAILTGLREVLLRQTELGLRALDLPLPELSVRSPRSAPTHPLTHLNEEPTHDLFALSRAVHACRSCRLYEARTGAVTGTGPRGAAVMFIGDAPNRDEDLQGMPFVGESGALLTRMLRAMGLTRESVFLTHVVKCRPPRSRQPVFDEAQACAKHLHAQIRLVAPQVIVTLGSFASQLVLQGETTFHFSRGQWGHFADIPVMPTYHPAYLLEAPQNKKCVWEDLQAVMLKLSSGVGGS